MSSRIKKKFFWKKVILNFSKPLRKIQLLLMYFNFRQANCNNSTGTEQWQTVGVKFLTVGREVMSKQGGEARMMQVVMDYSWKHQYELMLFYLSISLSNHIYRQLHIVTQVSIHTCISLLSAKKAEKHSYPVAMRILWTKILV